MFWKNIFDTAVVVELIPESVNQIRNLERIVRKNCPSNPTQTSSIKVNRFDFCFMCCHFHFSREFFYFSGSPREGREDGLTLNVYSHNCCSTKVGKYEGILNNKSIYYIWGCDMFTSTTAALQS